MTSSVGFSSGLSNYGLGSLLPSASSSSISGTLSALVSSLNASTAAPSAPVDSTQVEISGLGQLLSALTSFQESVQSLEPPSISFNSTVSNTNPAIASASATSGATPATYNLVVGSLAQSQTLESSAFADTGTTIVGTGTLTIQAGTYNSSANTFTATGGSTNVTINTGTLSDIANSINAANAGVFATIAQDSNGYHLALTNSQTGAANNFEVTVSDSDGNNTDTSGLSQIAYDPTATVGSGQNLTQMQAAASASYTINGVQSSSAHNANITIGPGVTASLMETGSTTLGVSADPNSATGAAQTLVNAYNTLQSFINNLEASNATISQEPSVSALTQALASQSQASYNNGTSSLTSLGQIGISYQYPSIALLESTNFAGGGSLSLNTTTLQNALASDPNGTQSIIGLAAQGFDSLSSVYGVPGGNLSDLVNFLQQVDAVNQSLVQQPLSSNPSVSDILSAQQSDNNFSFSAQQISGLQQYAQSYSLILPQLVESALVSFLGGSSGSTGNLLSVFA